VVDALERSETGEGVRPRVRARPQQVEVVAGGRHLGEAVRRQQGADQPGVALAQTERQAAVAARSHGRRGRQGAGPKAHHRRFPALVHGQQPIVRLPVPEREQQTTNNKQQQQYQSHNQSPLVLFVTFFVHRFHGAAPNWVDLFSWSTAFY